MDTQTRWRWKIPGRPSMTAALRLDSLTESQARILGDCFGTTLEKIDGSDHHESPYAVASGAVSPQKSGHGPD